MNDDQDLDNQLRAMAHESFAARAAGIDVESELREISAKLGDEPMGRQPASPKRERGNWLMAAAVVALITGGIVTIGWVRSSNGPTVSPLDTVPTTQTTGPAPQVAPTVVVETSTPTSTPSATPSSVAATSDPSPTSLPATPLSRSAATPAVVRAGEVVTITPPAVIERPCLDMVALLAVADAPGDAVDGLIGYGKWVPAPAEGISAMDRPDCGVTTSQAAVSFVVPADVPVGTYDMCLTRYDDPTGCARVEVAAASPNLPQPSTVSAAALTDLDVGFFTRRSTDEPPYYELTQTSRGQDESPVGASELAVILGPTVLFDGWVVKLDGERASARCENQTVLVPGESSFVVDTMQRELPFARSIAVNSLGAVWAGRDVCPEGTRWGDPGTYFELVALDLTDENPTAKVVQTRPADPDAIWFDDGVNVGAPGELLVYSLSADGRFAGVAETLHPERTRWHVFDRDTPGEPVSLASSCPIAGDIIGMPSFVSRDGTEISFLVAVPRLCSSLVTSDFPSDQLVGDGDVQVEVVGLATSSTPNEVVWRAAVAGLAADGYSKGAFVSARLDTTDRIVALLTAGGDVEQQSRTFVLVGDDATEITSERSETSAFYPRDLFSPWDLGQLCGSPGLCVT